MDPGQSSGALSPSDQANHRVYDGTPEKVSKRKLIEISNFEKRVVFRAKQVTTSEVQSLLAADEVLITHRRIKSDQEKQNILSEVFSPEVVVVVEALFLLQEFFDIEYTSLAGLRDFSLHMGVLLLDVPVEEKPSFSRFCYGLWQTIHRDSIGTPIPIAKGKASSKRVTAVEKAKDCNKKRAAIAAGVKLFIAVGDAVIENNPENAELKNVCCFNLANIEAWVELFERKQDRHMASHPFKFIGGDVEKAYKGLAVLEYVQDTKDYEVLSPLIKAAIPQVLKAIKEKEAESGRKREERGIQKNIMRSHFISQLNDIMDEFGIVEI